MPLLHIEIRINLYKQEDMEFNQLVTDLKARRQLSDIVRDGIRLVVDLRAGRTDVLCALFPFVARGFVQDNVQDNVQDTVQDKPAEPKPIAIGNIAMPLFEEDEEDTLLIKRDTKSAEASSNAFMDSISQFIH